MTKWIPLLELGESPRYLALADAIERDVQQGVLRPGDKLPTHRDLADDMDLNVSTVTRGYGEAGKRGLVSGTVGRGTFIAADAATSTAMVAFEPKQPGLIDMGLVEPLFRLDPDLSEGFRRLSRRKDPASLLRYSDPRGLPEHRAAGAHWAARYGLEAEAEDMIVCAGAQHALTCILAGLLRPGDRLATDSLTYPGLKTLAAMLGIRLTPIPMDGQGMTPQGLDAACRRDGIRAVYLMPGMQNPTTAVMGDERRDDLARLARGHDLFVIEDDAYDLTLPQRRRPLAARVPERGVYVAGMSKSLAAGLRVAFVAAPRHCREPLARAVLNTIWMAPPLNVELASMWIRDGTADKTIKAKRTEAAQRFALASSMLSAWTVHGHPTGFYFWLELPGGWRGAAFERAAQKEGVSVFGAEKFAVGEAAVPAAARISLTGTASLEEVRSGLAILDNLLRRGPA